MGAHRMSNRDFNDAAIESATVECNGNRARAVALVARQNPKLREALVAEANRR